MAAKTSHIATSNLALAPVEPRWSLTWFLTMPHVTKSITITTSVTSQAKKARALATRAPMMDEPRAAKKAMNANPQATGWRTMTFVRPEAVLVDVPL